VSSESDLIDAEVAAYRDRDLERFVNYFSPSVKVMDASGRTLIEGAEALRTYYEQLFANSPNLAVKIVARIAVGQFVIDHERIEGVVSPSRPFVQGRASIGSRTGGSQRCNSSCDCAHWTRQICGPRPAIRDTRTSATLPDAPA